MSLEICLITMKLKFANFFTHFFLLHPESSELDKKDSQRALICSIVLGVFTLGIVHGVCALIEWNIKLTDKNDKEIQQIQGLADKAIGLSRGEQTKDEVSKSSEVKKSSKKATIKLENKKEKEIQEKTEEKTEKTEKKQLRNFLDWITETISTEQDKSLLEVSRETVDILKKEQVNSSTQTLSKRIFNVLKNILEYKDEEKLLLTDYKVSSSEHAWTVNKALLKSAYERSDDVALQKQIEFISTNYLGTVAPVYINLMKNLLPSIERFFHVNPRVHFSYHRYGFMENLGVGSEINQSFAIPDRSPLIPTDTDQFEEFLPLSFTLLNKNNRREWKKNIYQAVKLYIESNPKEVIGENLDVGFLFDLTDNFQETIRTDGVKQKEKEFEKQFKIIKQEIQENIDEVVCDLLKEFPKLSKRKLKRLIHTSSTSICRVHLKEKEVSGVKVLPLFSNLRGERIRTAHPKFLNFLSNTGLFIGAVNMRRHLVDSFNEGQGVEYAVQKGDKDAVFFPNKDAFIRSALFTRLSNQMNDLDYQQNYPQARVMIQPILKMLEGLFNNEIGEKRWQSFNKPGASREILQTTLFKLQEHLATAELYAKTDFAQFGKAIELAHAEIAILLEVFRPFNITDFSEIYQNNLKIVPEELQNSVVAGLGRTGINLFAATNVAIQKSNSTPLRAYGKGFYFEQVGLMGEDKKIDNVLKDPKKVNKVDLYACQFNPNIDVDTDHTHYEVASVAEEIKILLQDRGVDRPLTVVIDSTIDYIQSEKIKNLLEQFQEEVKVGKLNFISFRSGQKLDMFGTDFYYGSSFFMVNNGDAKWEPFKVALQSKEVQIDPLSQQWFCLAYKYAVSELDDYRKQIFDNSRRVLADCPENLTASLSFPDQRITVSTIDDKMEACFIDIKVKGVMHKLKALSLLVRFYLRCLENKIKVHSRASFGFPHLNFIVIMIQEVPDSTTIRLNPGIDPRENQFIIDFLKKLSEEQK